MEKTLKESFLGLKNSQKTIDNLLEISSIKLRDLNKPSTSWQLEPLHQDLLCNIGLVYIDKEKFGPCENHVHVDSKEYLIVVSGSIMLNIEGKDVRILKTGDCGAVPAGQAHFSRPLEDGTKLAYVCVPADAGMTELAKALEK